MPLEPGEKIHLVERRFLEADARRHFVGEIQQREGTLIRVTGHLFVFDGATSRFVRKPERRTRVITLDNRVIVNVIPATVDVTALRYAVSEDRRLVVTDGEDFQLDINEFSPVQ